MSRKTLNSIATLAAVLATTAVIPATSAANTDLRSPDARDAARVVAVNNGQDLRSPDGRDAARPSLTPAPSATPDNGTDWGEIGMISGAVFLALLGSGAVLYVTRRRGHVRRPGATVAPS
jgi:hypothetical protein